MMFFFFLMITKNDSLSVPIQPLSFKVLNTVVTETPFCPHVWKRLLCQQSVMSSQKRKGMERFTVAACWQKHPPRVPCYTAILWHGFTCILVNAESGASCPVLLLVLPSITWTWGFFGPLVCERGLDFFWLLVLFWISSFSWSEKMVVGTSL